MDEMKEASIEAKAFMLEHGAEADKAALVGQFLVDLGEVLVLWGAEDSERFHADIRLVCNPDNSQLSTHNNSKLSTLLDDSRARQPQALRPRQMAGRSQ